MIIVFNIYFTAVLYLFYLMWGIFIAVTWEQRKLGEESSEIIAGGDIDKNLIKENGSFPVVANALTKEGIIGYYESQFRVKGPAITVTARGDVGHAKARIYDFTPVVRLISIKTNHDVLFMENVINTLQIVIESTGVPQLTVPQLSTYSFKFPASLQEEIKIGKLFLGIDNLITLHQRKCCNIRMLLIQINKILNNIGMYKRGRLYGV